MTDKTITLCYTEDGDVVKFDFYMFPLDLIPKLVKQLNLELFLRANSEDFQAERAQHAQNNGNSLARQTALDLRLKYVPND